MEIKFIVTKDERKALVSAISGITGCGSVYKGAPGFEFAVGNYIIDRYGTLSCDEQTDAKDVRNLLLGLTERGFVFEGDIDEITPGVPEQNESVSDDLTKREGIPEESENSENDADQSIKPESENGGETESGESCNGKSDDDSGESFKTESDDVSGRLSINMPLFGFNATSIDNLQKLVTAKAWILKKMTGANELPIERDEKYLNFPWFKQGASAAEIDAYSRLIAGMCETAKKKQRVTATERQLKDGDNEKFKARCFLLSLDFIGKEYTQARKILLASMSGSGSFKSGSSKQSDAHGGAKIAENGTENVEAINAREDGSDADNAATGVETAAHEGEEVTQNIVNSTEPTKCSECWHHCYYSDGLMRTKAGDIVDTSKRTPDKYTHYCLNVPSGYRKIKHASDWSGCENAPKWCSLNADSTAESGEEVAV